MNALQFLPFGKFRYFDFAQYRSGLREYKLLSAILLKDMPE